MAHATPRSAGRVLLNVPILNEIDNIEHLVTSVLQQLEGYEATLLIVDDGSTDGTLDYVHRMVAETKGRVALLQRRKTLRGCQRGAALLAGLKWGLANGNYDVFIEMDGDLSHRPEELRDGIAALNEGTCDVIIGSKYVRGSQIVGRSVGRTMISLICNYAVRAVISWRIVDFSNGYRWYNRRAALLVPQFQIRYGSPIYLTEAMAIWLGHGLRVGEIPSTYVGRSEGLSKVRFNDYIKAAIGVIEIGLRYRLTGFRRIAAPHEADPAVAPVAQPASEWRQTDG